MLLCWWHQLLNLLFKVIQMWPLFYLKSGNSSLWRYFYSENFHPVTFGSVGTISTHLQLWQFSSLKALLICWCSFNSLPQHLDLLSICFCCWVTKHYSPGSILCVFNPAVSVRFVRSKVVLGGCAAVWTALPGDPQAWITFTESYVSRGPKRSTCQQCAWPFATAYFGPTPCSWGGFLPNSTDKPAHPQKINSWPAYRKIAIKTNVCFFLFFLPLPLFLLWFRNRWGW